MKILLLISVFFSLTSCSSYEFQGESQSEIQREEARPGKRSNAGAERTFQDYRRQEIDESTNNQLSRPGRQIIDQKPF